ncbi:peptide deformylase [Candidatus Saccharibacteria bacterium]|nr:peptide deformylase [Candidatus Saccharibacteria bacterium]
MIKDSYQKLKITQFGNPVLRQVASNLSISEIKSPETKHLINKMREFLKTKKLGIGLAAPQVGVSKQIAIIEIQKTPIRDNIEPLSLAIINPEITKNYGRKTQLWEGCISCGSGSAALFAKVPRHKKLELEYYDENGTKRREIFTDLPAHVIQHEVDHLNGVLFVDKVKDTKSYMTFSEYKKMKKSKA